MRTGWELIENYWLAGWPAGWLTGRLQACWLAGWLALAAGWPGLAWLDWRGLAGLAESSRTRPNRLPWRPSGSTVRPQACSADPGSACLQATWHCGRRGRHGRTPANPTTKTTFSLLSLPTLAASWHSAPTASCHIARQVSHPWWTAGETSNRAEAQTDARHKPKVGLAWPGCPGLKQSHLTVCHGVPTGPQ